MLALYNTLISPLRIALWVRSWLPGNRQREWDQRFGRSTPPAVQGGLWLHGASVGEARLLRTLADGLQRTRPRRPIYASAVTRTGREQLPPEGPGRVSFFAPLDFRGLPSRVLRRLQPRALILIETELWPNLLGESLAAGVRVLVVNGRLTGSRMSSYRRVRRLLGPLLEQVTVAAQSEADAARFAELGVPRNAIRITGNIKYDLPAPVVDAEVLRQRFALGTRPVLVAGSTGEGEEPLVIDAFRRLAPSRNPPLLVLAPRYPERAPAVAELARGRGLKTHTLSSGRDREAGGADVLLVDTLGQLSELYSLAAVAFVGGSLVPIGGHNVLEPAACGVPVLFGPHTESVREPAEELVEKGGARVVGDDAELAAGWQDLLADPARRRAMGAAALGVVRDNRGALKRTLEIIEEICR